MISVRPTFPRSPLILMRVTQRAIYTNEGIINYIGKTSDANTLDRGIAATVANPSKYIHAKAPPFLIFHGNQDRMVSPSQTLLLHDALVDCGRSQQSLCSGRSRARRPDLHG